MSLQRLGIACIGKYSYSLSPTPVFTSVHAISHRSKAIAASWRRCTCLLNTVILLTTGSNMRSHVLSCTVTLCQCALSVLSCTLSALSVCSHALSCALMRSHARSCGLSGYAHACSRALMCCHALSVVSLMHAHVRLCALVQSIFQVQTYCKGPRRPSYVHLRHE